MDDKTISQPVQLPQNIASALANITLPTPNEGAKKQPKLETCEVGPFRLPGVKIDLEQFSEEQIKEMDDWARENGAYVGNGLYSWRDVAKRDWFILRWS